MGNMEKNWKNGKFEHKLEIYGSASAFFSEVYVKI
jgi:hypothetical protein